jgi:hypothetical protein
MSSLAKQAREAMKAKASRLTTADPHQKVDSSNWTPAEPLNTEVKTGLRPVSRRAFKSGGKVTGAKAKSNLGKKPRKSGGEATQYAIAKINRNVKEANEERPGGKAHIGGMKKGGRTKRDGGGRLPGERTQLEQARRAAVQAAEDYGMDSANNTENLRKATRNFENKVMETGYRDYKKGGRTKSKKASGGATDAAKQMMMQAQKTAGVPAGGIYGAGFTRTGAGSMSPAGALGKQKLKKGGAPKHDDVKQDMALIKKMVKPSARKGRDAGGRLSESTRAAQASRDDYDASMASRRATENFLNSPDAEFDARLAMAESTRDNSRIMRKRAENIAKQTGYGSFTGDPMGRQDIDRLRNSPFIGTYRDHGSQTPSAYEEAMKRGGKAKRKGKAGGGGMGALGGLIPMAIGAMGGDDEKSGKKTGGRTKRKTGGGVFSGPGYPGKIPGVVPGGREAHAKGGKAKGKGKTHINIMIAAGKPGMGDMMPPGGPTLPPGMDQGPGGIAPVPMAPPPGGAPAPMPMPIPMPMPMGGGAPAGGPPMPRKAGGRISKVASSYKDMEAGSGGGEGRLQKTDIAKKHKGAPTFKKGGKVYRSYKDMDAGSGSGLGRLEKTEIQKRKG